MLRVREERVHVLGWDGDDRMKGGGERRPAPIFPFPGEAVRSEGLAPARPPAACTCLARSASWAGFNYLIAVISTRVRVGGRNVRSNAVLRIVTAAEDCCQRLPW